MSFKLNVLQVFRNKYPLQLSLLTGIGVGSYCFYNMYREKINTCLNLNQYIQPIKTIQTINTIHKNKLIFISDQKFYSDLVQYIYINYENEINEFTYQEENIYSFNEWRFRRKENPASMKVLFPIECNFTIKYKDSTINIDISMMKDDKLNPIKLLAAEGCVSKENLVQKIDLESENKQLLIDFVDEAREYMKNEYEKHRKASKETMCVYYYKKDYWILLSKAPKRPIDTIYLKKGERDKLVNDVEYFFSKDTRDIYLSYGIPYKSINMIYGPPGSGKTSTIKGIASVLDCDVYILPISKDMVDSDLVSAFTYINDKEEAKQRIIVIEDIDTLFDDRKAGDKDSGITLQAFLNCMDGFTCIEGTMLFITANKPEVLDYALLRSCRIDNKIELGYADEYQTKEMFTKFLPNQSDKFKEFYNQIRHKEYTIAMLQEFLFYNRECENIVDLMDKFTEIMEKNNPKNYEILKDVNKNFYS